MSYWIKALTVIAFALALVLSPPTAAHAASGMHDGHQARSADIVRAAKAHDDTEIGHVAHAKLKVAGDIGLPGADKQGKKKQSEECCNGICISVVFLEDTKIEAEPVGTSEYVILDGQTYSVETAGFLRPPRFLI